MNIDSLIIAGILGFSQTARAIAESARRAEEAYTQMVELAQILGRPVTELESQVQGLAETTGMTYEEAYGRVYRETLSVGSRFLERALHPTGEVPK